MVITEMEKNGRVREITQFVTGSHKGHKDYIAQTIRKQFENSTLEYLGENLKEVGRSGLPSPTASSPRQLPGPKSLGDGMNILSPQSESVKQEPTALFCYIRSSRARVKLP